MKPIKLTGFAIAFLFMIEIELWYVWTSTIDYALYLYHIQYHDIYLAYGVLWTWMNPNWWTNELYKAELSIWVVAFAVFQWFLVSKKKLPKLIMVLAQFQNTIWCFVGGYQQITVTDTASLAFYNPLFVIPWILQKIPLGWSWNLQDSHFQCAFGNVVIGYVIAGKWYQGCGPGLFFGSTGLTIWHLMELFWIFGAVLYWSWRWRGVPVKILRSINRRWKAWSEYA